MMVNLKKYQVLFFLPILVWGFPTEIGTKWVYTNPSIIDSIIGDTTFNDLTYAVVNRHFSNDSSDIYYFRPMGDTIYLLDSIQNDVNFESIMFDFSITNETRSLDFEILHFYEYTYFNDVDCPCYIEQIDSSSITISTQGSTIVWIKDIGFGVDMYFCLIVDQCPVYTYLLNSVTNGTDTLYNRENTVSISNKMVRKNFTDYTSVITKKYFDLRGQELDFEDLDNKGLYLKQIIYSNGSKLNEKLIIMR